MRRERRQPTRREWAAITPKRPTVRRIPPPTERKRAIDPTEEVDEGKERFVERGRPEVRAWWPFERKGKRVCTTLWPIRRFRNRS